MPQEVFGMIDSHELKKRDIYLKKLIGFRDTEPVKVITGIRRCGKSSLLKLMVQHLKDTGVLPEQISVCERAHCPWKADVSFL